MRVVRRTIGKPLNLRKSQEPAPVNLYEFRKYSISNYVAFFNQWNVVLGSGFFLVIGIRQFFWGFLACT